MNPKPIGETEPPTADDLYREASANYGSAIVRMVRAYEFEPDRRKDLEQEIHLALWRSLRRFEGRCSLRTWVYRVAHNTAVSWVLRQKRARGPGLVSLEDIPSGADSIRGRASTSPERLDAGRLLALVHRLRPPDRQLMLLYLEGLDTATTSEITGLSEANVRTKVHRIKKVLAARFHRGEGADA